MYERYRRFGHQTYTTHMTISSIQDLLNPFTYDQATRKKDTVVNEELLAISAALCRQFKKDNSLRFIEFDRALETITVTDEDREMANLITVHFDKQFMMTLLDERPLSKFQEALNKFLFSDRRSYTDETKGMIYRLPEFYEYDNDLANIVKENYSDFRKNIADKFLGNEMELKPIRSLNKNLRSGNKKQYWFKEVDNNTPVMLQFKSDNSLLYLWDHMFNTRESIVIGEAKLIGRKHPSGLQYASSEKWQMKDI